MKLSDFTVRAMDGEAVSLAAYEGDVVLVVNTASKCGFTPQFEGLEQLYTTYRDRGFTVLGFPCNQFASQDPGTNEEIEQFCQLNYGVTFPMFAKIDVNGDEEDPLYTWLKEEQSGLLGGAIKWNFTKFLIDRDGRVLKRFAPQTKPERLVDDIESIL